MEDLFTNNTKLKAFRYFHKIYGDQNVNIKNIIKSNLRVIKI